MKISAKLLAAAGVSVVLLSTATFLTQRASSRQQRLSVNRATMRNILLQAEDTRGAVARFHEIGAMDLTKLAQEVKSGTRLRDSKVYETIPVVAAWKSASKVAHKEGFDFRVIAREARNADNIPDPAEEPILDFFQRPGNADEDYFKVDEKAGRIVYARPVILTKDCLQCHGDPASSPTGDGRDLLGFEMENWSVGQRHGAFVLSAPIDRVDPAVAGEIRKSSIMTFSLLGGGLLVSTAWVLFIARGISRNLGRAQDLVRRVAARDLTARTDVTANDETGEMCRELNRMVGAFGESIEQVDTSAASLREASRALTAVSDEVRLGAGETSDQAQVVASAAEQVSQSVSSVATAAEEMSAAIREVAERAAQAASVASRASTSTRETNAMISKLSESSTEIGGVIKVITSIAEQTHLLALNATIEAARAGEAGKGFAVVASEVKELASQTAKATSDIRTKVEAIQRDSERAVVAVGDISSVIEEINDIQTTIASSVEEQAATMNEISASSAEASRGSTEIARSICSVSDGAQKATTSADKTAASASELSQLSEKLRDLVARFRIRGADDRSAAADEVFEVPAGERMPTVVKHAHRRRRPMR